ncbi:MAG: chromate resistance protein [Methylococcaceae bacterium]|nr:chromate resistance protein [Methylococcaceae bacterium]
MAWLLLILTLPTENATARMRAWRSLKASGAAVLRDGAYLLPERDRCRAILESIRGDVQASGGSAYLLTVAEPADDSFTGLFDRGDAYGDLLGEITQTSQLLTAHNGQKVLKAVRQLRKAYITLQSIDFFPGEAQRQTESALADLQLRIHRSLTPDEPHDVPGNIPRRNSADFRGRTWATRRRPWVDRLASAWLIRRFIDPEATIRWIDSAADCPAQALGFDFDGATFSHIGGKVSFEVLAASFDLADPALSRIGGLVHYLDVGGVQPAEAIGVEQVLAGLRSVIDDDDRLLLAASGVFDGLYGAFANDALAP